MFFFDSEIKAKNTKNKSPNTQMELTTTKTDLRHFGRAVKKEQKEREKTEKLLMEKKEEVKMIQVSELIVFF